MKKKLLYTAVFLICFIFASILFKSCVESGQAEVEKHQTKQEARIGKFQVNTKEMRNAETKKIYKVLFWIKPEGGKEMYGQLRFGKEGMTLSFTDSTLYTVSTLNEVKMLEVVMEAYQTGEFVPPANQ